MDRKTSPITDLYGAAPGNESSTKYWYHVFLFILLVLAGLFVYYSIHTSMRLRHSPPQAVLSARLNSGEAGYRSQEKMAQVCWDYAIEFLQKSYPYGKSLPKNPPPVSSKRTGNPPAIRDSCWPVLRLAWTRPESWVRSYEWDTNWLTSRRSSFRRMLRRIVDFLNVTQ